ncbi:TIGR02453 family protein, partial [Lysobacter sp. A3-1-A15]
LAGVSPHYRSEPKTVGGSLFRIQRDTRFANDKSPYKSWQGARLFHARGRQVPAPSFYLHLQAGKCFVGAGLWHPDSATLRRLRKFILDNPGSWQAAAHASTFRKRFDLDDSEMLTRMPRGFPDDFEFASDLKRKNFVALR